MRYETKQSSQKWKHKWLKSMFPTSFTIIEIQIKTTLRFYLAESGGLSSIKEMANTRVYVRKGKHLLITGGKANWGRRSENQCGGSSKKLQINLLHDPILLLPVFAYPNDPHSCFRGTCQCLFSISNSQDMETTSMSIS